MPLRRLLSILTSNHRIIESLSETKIMRRTAQIVVGLYHRIKAGHFDHNFGEKNRFLNTFKDELSKEHQKMKRDGKL